MLLLYFDVDVEDLWAFGRVGSKSVISADLHVTVSQIKKKRRRASEAS